MSRLALLVLLWTFPALVLAEDTKLAFSVNHREDPRDTTLGSQLVYRLKEEVRKSTQLELVYSDEQSVYSIDVSTMVRTEEEDDPSQVLYGATLSVKDMPSGAWILMDQTIGYSGRNRLQDTATDLMVWIDKNVEVAVKARIAGLVRMSKECTDEKTNKKKDASNL